MPSAKPRTAGSSTRACPQASMSLASTGPETEPVSM